MLNSCSSGQVPMLLARTCTPALFLASRKDNNLGFRPRAYAAHARGDDLVGLDQTARSRDVGSRCWSVTARRRDEVALLDLVHDKPRQSVHALGEQLRCRMIVARRIRCTRAALRRKSALRSYNPAARSSIVLANSSAPRLGVTLERRRCFRSPIAEQIVSTLQRVG